MQKIIQIGIKQIMKLLSRLRTFFEASIPIKENKPYSLGFLNMSQFLGVLNDNLFKLVIVFLLIGAEGAVQASSILSIVGAVYVVPFLLFSSSAGVLADRFSKQRLLILMKAVEMILMALSVWAFAVKSPWACYTLLFFLATHSAIFGPSKYGIIPELVLSDKVSRANGLITSFTYLAIIFGTFLASFLTQITNRAFPLIALFCLLIALLGFLCAFGIKRTKPQGSIKKINFLFIREIYYTAVFCKQKRPLLPAILGSAFFLFIGGFTQLNVIPYAIQSLHLTEVAGGYLFLSTALGIAAGAFIAGKASKKRTELGLSCIAGLGMACIFVLLGIMPHSVVSSVILLVLLGVTGGCFIVPFDTFIQMNSPDEKRGQVIAAANFLGFFGVLLAAVALYLFNEILGLSSASSFAAIGIMTLIISIIFLARLSDFSLPYLSKKILKPLYRLEDSDISMVENSAFPIIVLQDATWTKALLLLSQLPTLNLLLLEKRKGFPWIDRFFRSIHLIKGEEKGVEIAKTIKQEEGGMSCLFLEEGASLEPINNTLSLKDLFKRGKPEFIYATLTRSTTGGQFFTFSKQP
jgi:acyl-[acyl-carrier-protein]-phospholipid O-acyltransferase/long-chain-fatty-acid--[acyl-carrier-protein] ligase